MELKNKVVLVTGSSSGIGQAIAVAFAKKGAIVLVHFRSNEQGAKATLRGVKEYSKGRIYKADLTRPLDIQKMFTSIKRGVGRVDILVNNAGDARPGDLFDEEILKHQYKSIFMTAINTTRSFLEMKSKLQKKIVNITSDYGNLNMVNPEYAAYSMMKGALNNFTTILAKSAGKNVLVNAIAPGYTWTPPWEGVSRKEKIRYGNSTRIKRFIQPEEIAHVVIMLAENDAITGQVITVDGGLSLMDMNHHEG
jgi:3-oxoacyl-[acyl-carrier protein] reductase